MSIKLMTMAFNAYVNNPVRKLILIKLCDNANDDGVCWPSYGRIADQCEVTKRCAMEHIKWLSENGFLEVESRFKDGNQSSNCYTISTSKLMQASTNRGENNSPPSEQYSPPLVNVVHPPSEHCSPRITTEPSKGTTNKTIVPKNKFSDEDFKCAEWLSVKLKEFIPDCKTPNLNGWAKSVRDMRELDNRDHKEICQLWLWCRKDSFEAANVQSPEKLRKRYDQLKIKMKSPAVGGSYAGQSKPSLIDRFIATNYGSGSQDDYGPMGGDDSVIRGEVVEPVRGDAGRLGAMEADIIGDFTATGGGCT